MIVLNKSDSVDEHRLIEVNHEITRGPLKGAILVSALAGDGLQQLGDLIATEFKRTLKALTFLFRSRMKRHVRTAPTSR